LVTKAKQFNTLDLFAGIGGVRIGFDSAGFSTAFSNDVEPLCKVTYDLNFKTALLHVQDLKTIPIDNFPDFDILLGGFPCQAFSVAGYRQGFNDEKGRGNLFFNIAQILEERRPTAFFLENVKNLQGHDNRNTFRVICETLEGLNYKIHYKVLNTMEYGNLPQNRERIYICGFLNSTHAKNFSFPDKKLRTVDVLDLLDEEVDRRYYYDDKPLFSRLVNDVKDIGTVYQWRRQYVRENKSGVCPTLTANMGTGGHNVPIIRDARGIRKLTPIECARIQGFPEWYELPKIADSALYKQIGNSVSVPVVQSIAERMMDALSGK
jgi:DNA (cytosine-5)-methyltransferase 1